MNYHTTIKHSFSTPTPFQQAVLSNLIDSAPILSLEVFSMHEIFCNIFCNIVKGNQSRNGGRYFTGPKYTRASKLRHFLNNFQIYVGTGPVAIRVNLKGSEKKRYLINHMK